MPKKIRVSHNPNKDPIPSPPPVIGGGGGTSETVDLPTLLTTTVASTPSPGSTTHVASGGDLQAALDAAVAGDVITLEAGASYPGNFILNNRAGGDYITLRTDGSLPPEGSRATAAIATAYGFPKLIAMTGNGTGTLNTNGPVTKWRVMGLDITVDPDVTSITTIVKLGLGTETLLADLPENIILDRCYVHGHSTLQCRRGITLNSKAAAFIDGIVDDIHSDGFDTQAIWGWNGPGPFKIVNNKLVASTEVFGFGGADPALVGNNPADIEFSRNHVTRPMSWKGNTYLEKNLIELKKGIRVLIEGNVLENAWPQAQSGWGFVLWSVNQQGGDNTAETGHITVRKNIIKNTATLFQLSAHYASTSVPMHHVTIHDNVGLGVNNPAVVGADPMILAQQGIAHLSIEHNTALMNPGATSALLITNDIVYEYLKIRNNILGGGSYPLFISPGPTWADIADVNSLFDGNVFVAAAAYAASFGMPVGNFYPASNDDIGFVGGGSAATDVNALLDSLKLSNTSAYKAAATDGTDPGADIDAVKVATDGVVI